ncbi:MAG: adenylate/guanylate cyclase domain-containing protein, partial [Myxococcota bacterium]|nr:adenylate/guanylate cyclase domain-containing protein [Myxococcota bacterium]
SYLAIYPLAILNVFSCIAWAVLVWWHFRGGKAIGSIVAIAEVIIHAAACVILIGWESGFQFYLFCLPFLTYLAPWFSTQTKAVLTMLYAGIFAMLSYHYSAAEPIYTLPPLLYQILNFGNICAIFFSIALTCFYYESGTQKTQRELTEAKGKSDEMTVLLKKMFGRYLSADVMKSLIADPSNLELGGERREVTIMMTDLRGFTSISERLEPEEVVQLLNTYFEIMVEIVLRYNGTINEFIGDALLVVFGAPNHLEDRTEQAVACAIEMQNAMRNVNLENVSKGLPELKMGIGLNETEVVVGNIGSHKRSKYAVVGSGVNMTSRIESYTSGGQILISESVYRKIVNLLRIDSEREVLPKGAASPIRIYEVGGIAGKYQQVLDIEHDDWVALPSPLAISYTTLDGKNISKEEKIGLIQKVSSAALLIELETALPVLQNIKFNLTQVPNKIKSKDIYAKVLEQMNQTEHVDGKHLLHVRCTSVPPEVDGYFQALRQHML